jgi:predicted nucleic acid-binding protein
MDITLDSNVLVYAFVPPIHRNKEKREEWNNLHIKAKKIYESVIRGKQKLILPFAVIVEVASVVALLTGKDEYGKDVAMEIEDSAQIILFDSDLKERALDYAIKIKAGGFDNFIAITAILFGTTLITNDRPFYNKLILLSGEYQFNVRLFRSMDLDDLNF